MFSPENALVSPAGKILLDVDPPEAHSTYRWRGISRAPGTWHLAPGTWHHSEGELMRFLIIVKATTDSEAGAMPDQRIFDAMADYHQQLQEAGVLLDASGLQPSAKGWRVKYAGGKRTIVDGPFA